MELEAFCRQSRVVVVLGKGGVGKTTLTAALALAGARAGLDVLVVALDDSGDLPALFGRAEPFGYDEVLLAGCPKEPEDDAGQPQEAAPGAPRTGPAGGRVRARVVTSRAALLEYLDDHGLRRVSRRLVDSGALDVVSTAIPGIEEVLVLGKVKQLERERRADLILLDAPATGHAVTFLSSSEGLVDAARGGPLRQQAEQVVELLSDPTRCQALLVTLPEETPVNELVEAAYRLEDEVGVALGPVVVNGCYPELEGLETDPAVAARAAQEPEPDASYSGRLRRAAEFRLAKRVP
ncbi:MAG: oxyanion-translocating ATPase [Acidimicrobiaceae bacterium]|nr:oxyanion-translocating ATPase [Acidimicrobiaceae bacterium]